MATIEGRDLAKMMQHLGDRILSDLGDVEFDDGISEEPMRVLSVSRETIELQVGGRLPKTVSRAVASKGTIVDLSGVVTSAIGELTSEPFPRRAARLLGDITLEPAIYQRLPRRIRDHTDAFAVLPDEIAIIIGHFLLEHSVAAEDLKKAYEVAQRFQLFDVTYILHTAVHGPIVLPKTTEYDDLFKFMHDEAARCFSYSDSKAPFIWPSPVWFNDTNRPIARDAARLLTSAGYAFGEEEIQRRSGLTLLIKKAPPEQFDNTPVGSNGRLRLIALGVAWLVDNATRNNQSNAKIFQSDFSWLRETHYDPEQRSII